MKTHLKILVPLFAMLLATNGTSGQDATKEPKDSLRTVVSKYYDFNVKIFQAN